MIALQHFFLIETVHYTIMSFNGFSDCKYYQNYIRPRMQDCFRFGVFNSFLKYLPSSSHWSVFNSTGDSASFPPMSCRIDFLNVLSWLFPKDSILLSSLSGKSSGDSKSWAITPTLRIPINKNMDARHDFGKKVFYVILQLKEAIYQTSIFYILRGFRLNKVIHALYACINLSLIGTRHITVVYRGRWEQRHMRCMGVGGGG